MQVAEVVGVHETTVSRAVAEAYAAGTPLRLALYSTDGDYHSGKYFWSSDASEQGRPTLQVRWGSLAQATDWVYLPLILHQ